MSGKTPKDIHVLVACEESQVVCKEFRSRGFDAWSCDLVECSGGHPEWHILGDAVDALHSRRWDILIAHPPCTYMSKAGARWMYPKAGQLSRERFERAMEAKAFFMKFLEADIPHRAVENPLPLKVVGLPPPTQTVQPYEFGEPYSKRTLLWLSGLPPLKPTRVLDKYVPWLPSNTGGLARGEGGSRGIAHDARTASRTFVGIAKAMAEQWGDYVMSLAVSRTRVDEFGSLITETSKAKDPE